MKTSDFAKKIIGDQTASRVIKPQKSSKKKPLVGFRPQKASVLYYGLNKSWISLVPHSCHSGRDRPQRFQIRKRYQYRKKVNMLLLTNNPRIVP